MHHSDTDVMADSNIYERGMIGMKKEVLKSLYEEYLRKNPEKVYIENVTPALAKGECIESAHLRNNPEIKENLPKFLEWEQVRELNGRYHNKLKWEMLESDVTGEQIMAYEKENGVTLPEQFREFLQGCSFLEGMFYPKCMVSEDYGDCWGRYDKEEGEIIEFTDEEWESDRKLIGNVGVYLYCNVNPNGIRRYAYYEKIGRIWIGTLDSGDPLLLDCEFGTVESRDHETWIGALQKAGSLGEFEHLCGSGDFWFKDFDSFLKWVFGKTVYIFEKAENEELEFYRAHYKPRWHPPEDIIYL